MKNFLSYFTVLLFLGSGIQAQEQIYFSSFRPQGWDIYLSKEKGENFSKFTSHESLDYDAKISPDGQWVVFTSERSGRPQLYIKNVTGDSIPRPLVSSSSMQDQVSFSPDNNWIVFVSTHQGNADIYKLPFKPTDTLSISDAVNLTNSPGGDFRPSYSKNGKSIAFSSDRAHPTIPHPRFVFAMQRTGDIYTMDQDGGNTKRLTSADNWQGSPVWYNNDEELLYYSAVRGEVSRLFKISASGDNPVLVSPENFSCLSPFAKADGNILFTSHVEQTNVFSILELNPGTQQIDSAFVRQEDMFNADYHPSGIMVFHGGNKPEEEKTNRNGFDGDLLVKNHPAKVRDIPDKTLALFGVRRAFAAPAIPGTTQIVYDHSEVRSLQQFITAYAYPLVLLPILAIIWLVLGIYRSIKKKAIIAFWKHLIFGLIAVGAALFIGMGAESRLFTDLLAVNEVQKFLWLAAGVLLVLALLAHFIGRKRKQTANAMASLYRLYAMMFILYALLAGYAGVMLASFFNTSKDFYAVDYTTKDVRHLFKFEPDGSFNPQFARIIDTKISPDGKLLHFSVGGFRRSPNAQGAIYSYNLEERVLKRETDVESNNGFSDFSADNQSLVFRSGRTGNMDIYIRENDSLINITNSPGKENFPVISYDGKKIAFCSDAKGVDKNGIVKTMDIYISEKVSGSWTEPRQLTTYEGQEGHAHFSPDGEWLVYASEEFGINDEQPLIQPYIFSPQMYGEITAIRISDGAKFRLTHNKWEDGAPLWIK